MLFSFENIQLHGVAGPRLAVRHLQIPADGMSVIVGPSGAGKSTLLRLCNRLEVADSGAIEFHGMDLNATPVLDLRRAVGMVFQEPVRFGGTVLDNLREADGLINDEAARMLLERVGLDGSFLSRLADELSGGEAQRMCIARALATGPELLLMDEPTSSLDPAATQLIEQQAIALTEAGMPVLWVTHDTAQMQRIASRVICLIDGAVAYEGPASGLFDSQEPEIVAFLAEQTS